MTSYRLYFLDEAGHILEVRAVEAPDDEHALKLCQPMIYGQRAELWNRARLVMRIAPELRQA